MERELLRLSETPLHLEKTWESGGVPVLTAEVTLPCCGGKSRRARRFGCLFECLPDRLHQAVHVDRFGEVVLRSVPELSLIHISEPTRRS